MLEKMSSNRIIKTFFLLLFFVLLFGMSIKNKNGTLSCYDLFLCCTTYSNITLYLIVPFIFINRLKSEIHYNILIRNKTIDAVWLCGCKATVLWGIEIAVMIIVSICFSSCIITDSVCDWMDKTSIFVRYTQYNLDRVPSWASIIIPSFILLSLNTIFVELIVYIGYWFFDAYIIGYCIVIVLYVVPEIGIFKFKINELGLYYSDYLCESNMYMVCIKRIVVLIACILVVVCIGTLRRRRDFIK